MPLIKIHISSTTLPFQKPILVKEARCVLIDTLKIDEKKGQVILYEAMPQLRCIQAERSLDFVYVEIIMMPGRTKEMKQDLMNKLKSLIQNHLEIPISDIICYINEIPEENWGI